jgi:hypothetical protein
MEVIRIHKDDADIYSINKKWHDKNCHQNGCWQFLLRIHNAVVLNSNKQKKIFLLCIDRLSYKFIT